MLSSVGGLVTAVTALLTIVEMRRQRESSYKPEIVVIPPELRFEPSTGFPPLLCRRKDTPSSEPLSGVAASVDCVNVGAGAARDILASWEFDHQLAAADLSPFLSNRGFSVWLDNNNTRIDFEENGQTRTTSFTDLHATTGVPFLLPAQSPETIFRVPLPPDYLLLMRMGIYSVPGHPSNDGPQVSLPRPPLLTLYLAYTDVGGARRRRVFKLQFHFTSYSSSMGPNGRSSLNEAEARATVAIQRIWPWNRK